MRTSNIGLYHCLCCGSVVEQELRRLPPFCCGIEMTKAAERTIPIAESLVPLPAAHRWAKTVGSRVAEHEPNSPPSGLCETLAVF